MAPRPDWSHKTVLAAELTAGIDLIAARKGLMVSHP